ncbi:MAG: crotonase/enoyl-CoA hydratase family protein [Polyangiaceae bacterium]
MSDRLRIHRDAGVAHVQLARPDKLNALDLAMFEALVAAGDELAGDRSLRAVVLSGEGRGFCAGLDVSNMAALASEQDKMFGLHGGGPANFAQQVAYAWMSLPVPVIAAVHGVCFGGGLQIALGADIRIVTPDARLSVMEIKWGLVPDMTGTQTLQRLVGLDVAKLLTFTGREVLGEEAVTLGLATQTSIEPVNAALALAKEIADKSPDAIRAGKRLLDEASYVDLATGLAQEAAAQKAVLGSPNQMEAVMAAMQKRAPRFQDPS